MTYGFGKINILAVGNLKEDYLRAAQAEFAKRLNPYGKLLITEIAHQATMEKEAEKIEKGFSGSSYKIALDVAGKPLSSEGFAASLAGLATNGHSHIEFIIGGADGISPRILKACQKSISLSSMTFTHQMARILLLEQIYRACRILNNEPYHK